MHEIIESIDDPAFLQSVKQILDQKQLEPPLKLVLYQENCLSQAMRSVEKGTVYSNEEANEMMDR